MLNSIHQPPAPRARIACTIPQGEGNMLPHFTWEFHFIYHLFAVQNSARFHASAKNHTFCYQFPPVFTFAPHNHIRATACALCARGFKRGGAPLPMGESGGPWVGPPAAFPPFVPVQMAYISELSRGALYNKQRKKFQPITRSTHQRGITTSSVTCR